MVLLLLPPKLGVGIAAMADTQKNGTAGPGSEAQMGEGPAPASTASHRTEIKCYV